MSKVEEKVIALEKKLEREEDELRRYLNRWAKYYYILPFFCAGLLYVNMYPGIVGGFGFLVFCLKMSKHRIVKISCSRCSANLKISL